MLMMRGKVGRLVGVAAMLAVVAAACGDSRLGADSSAIDDFVDALADN